jgi:arylsulfate sulfotransferase
MVKGTFAPRVGNDSNSEPRRCVSNEHRYSSHLKGTMFSKSLRCSYVLSVIPLASGCAPLQPMGRATATTNPQVASYTVNAPKNANVSVEFGVDTNYGFTTSPQPAPEGGGAVSVLVAGMHSNTLYHMRGIITLSDGSRFADRDQSFISGTLPAAQLPHLTVTTAAGMKPQSGIELVNILSLNKPVPVFATDLSGNVIWSYQFQGTSSDTIQPIKLLPNGHFVVVITPGSLAPLFPAPPVGTIDVIREIDLAGTTVREISIADLNTKLAAAGYDLTLEVFHHDVLPLANGHWIAIGNTLKPFTNLPGFPSTTNVLGDVLVDLDENLNPVWVWNEFDHFDVNRHPFMFPDWTHTNALVYSDDGNLLVSIRNQNWLVKVDYRDGVGTGDILWRLGYQGDFSLQGDTDPSDWFYAEHAPSFATSSTTGKFSLVLFDNGDDRVFPSNTTCQKVGVSSCPYSTVPILDIDETAKTATLAFHYVAPQYSGFGGNAEVLQNGNVEFDECDSTNLINPDADIYEVTQESNPQLVWHMDVAGQTAYRAFRLPSLYPGVQW